MTLSPIHWVPVQDKGSKIQGVEFGPMKTIPSDRLNQEYLTQQEGKGIVCGMASILTLVLTPILLPISASILNPILTLLLTFVLTSSLTSKSCNSSGSTVL